MRLLMVIGALSALLVVSAVPASAATRQATDREARIRFTLEGRVLTVEFRSGAPRRVRRQVLGKRVRATCQRYAPVVKMTDDRRWRRGKRRVRFRFARDISASARWCLLERRGDDVAFVNLAG